MTGWAMWSVNFNADGFDSLYPRYKGGYPLKFTLGQRREIKKIVMSKPAERDLPSLPGACRSWRSSWSLRWLTCRFSGQWMH